MLAQTKKELIYLQNQQKEYRRRMVKIRDILLKTSSPIRDGSISELDFPKIMLAKDPLLLWEQLSDFSYDLSTLFEIPQILAHLYWRFASCLTLDYIQLTLKEASPNSCSTWKVYFLKGLDKQNFIISEKQYAFEKIQPCRQITFHQDDKQTVHSVVAIPLFYLGNNIGVLGFACKKYYDWKSVSETFYLQLGRILARRAYSLCRQDKEGKLSISFAEFAREVLEPYKQEARERGIELYYSFTSSLLEETRPYLISELRQWLNLLAKDILGKTRETTVRLNFHEKDGKPIVQILSINSPCLLGEELAKYLKERDNFPTIQKKRNAYSLEIAFASSPCQR